MASSPPPPPPAPPESVASYASSGGGTDADQLEAVGRRANRVFRLLVHDEPLTSRQHLEAVRLLDKLHATAFHASNAGGGGSGRSAPIISRDDQLTIVCVLLALQRRCLRMRDAVEVAEALAQRAKSTDADDPSGRAAGSDDANDAAAAAAADEARERRRDLQDFEQTFLLSFLLVVTFDLAARGGVPPDGARARAELDELQTRLLWEELAAPPRRKRKTPHAEGDDEEDDEATDEAPDEAAAGEADAADAADEPTDGFEAQRALLDAIVSRPWRMRRDATQWASVLVQADPASTASAALRCAGSMIAAAEASEMDVSEARWLAEVFARATADQMMASLVKRDGDEEDFVSMGCQAIVMLPTADFDAQVETIASAAESETGQMILRDMVSSFCAPSHVIGTRRTLLLTRQAGETLAREYSPVAAYAHEIAMAGADAVWAGETFSELAKTCALLAGFAVLTTPKLGSQDLVLRHATAFGGHLHLPFLATGTIGSGRGPRLVLIPSKTTWILYCLGEDGKPQVLVSARGMAGLKLCLLAFQKATRT